jgi:hypothetical protein
MADYKAIKGQTIQNRTSDPLVAGIANGSWASGPAMNTARGVAGSGGPSTSAIVAGGYVPPSNTYSASSETFNGSAWTAAPSMNETSTEPGCFATSSEAAIAAGGYTTASPAGTRATAEEFDGSSWTEVGDMNEGRSSCSGTSWGTTTAGAIAAGVDGGSPGTNETLLEYWNGSAWSEQADLNLGRRDAGGAGTQTAAILGAGMSGSPYPGTITNNTETWNGSAWTEVAEMNNAQRAFGGSFGTSTAAIFAGGQPPEVTDTEYYDGTSWTEIGNMSTARSGGMGFGLAAAGYAYGDNNQSTAGEIFTSASITDSITTEGQMFYRSDTGDMKVTLTDYGTGAWASGGALPAAVRSGSGTGTQNTAFSFMVRAASSYPTATQNYNGTAWSTDPASINTGRAYAGSAGTPTSALGFGGQAPTSDANESYDGSSWSEQAEINTARHNIVGMGTQTAALGAGGEAPPITGATELWDGSSWSEEADLNQVRHGGAGGGVQTAGIVAGGASPSVVDNAETWNGTAWTEVSDLNAAKYELGGCGTQTAALVFGGNPALATTETWDGTSWTEVADLSTGRGDAAKNHQQTTQVEAIAVGGYSPPTYYANTEEWTVPSSLTNLTITD